MVCFRRRGFHGASMQEICGEAGLSAGALYRYFPSKSDIIVAIAEDHRRNSDPVFEQIGAGKLVDGICALADLTVSKCRSEAPLVAEVVAEAMRDPEFSARIGAHQANAHRRLATALSMAFRRTPTPGMSPERAARLVMLMLDGLSMRVLRGSVHDAADVSALLADFREASERLFEPTGQTTP